VNDGRTRPLARADLDADPFAQFRAWYEQAREEGVPAPEACALATSDRDGRPSARMVLLKDVDGRGFTFATNYESRKGRELVENPQAALLFYWHAQGRQVRVEGAVEMLTAGESDAIFAGRPRAARISALASEQSRPLRSRAELEERVASLAAELAERDVPRPERWGGYRLVPAAFEFWQHAEDRLHRRFAYSRDSGGWRIELLQP
jgi:pyridoxamine 5'-phosphate oxidase